MKTNIRTVTLDHLRCSKPKKAIFSTHCFYETLDGDMVKEKNNFLTKKLSYTLKGKPVKVNFYDIENQNVFFGTMHEFLNFLTD